MRVSPKIREDKYAQAASGGPKSGRTDSAREGQPSEIGTLSRMQGQAARVSREAYLLVTNLRTMPCHARNRMLLFSTLPTPDSI